ncbi:MAG TPA: phosphotransferase [Acidimicrobiales bacterium]|nr:phosphotransferase [Acidimicrobiales bacterium]
MTRPPYVLVGGVDEMQRAEVALAIANALGRTGVSTRVHRVVPRGSPRSALARSVPGSIARLAGWLAIFSLRVRLRRRALVVDGGWWELVVNPLPRRIHPHALVIGQLLGRLAPRAGVAVHVDAASAGAERMDRFDPLDPRYVGRWWRQALLSAGDRAITVGPDDDAGGVVVDAISASASDVDQSLSAWRVVPMAPPRRELRTTSSSPELALTIWRPMHPVMRPLARANRLLLGRFAVATPPPLEGLEELLAQLGLAGADLAAMRSSWTDRQVIVAGRNGRPAAFFKIGPAASRMREEAATIASLVHARTFAVPRVLFADEWQGNFVLATEAVEHRGDPRRLGVARVAPIAAELAAGAAGAPSLNHGDFAPWNVLEAPARPVLIDWELATSPAVPLADLLTFVTFKGSTLGGYRPADAVRDLTAPGSPGWSYLETLGIDGAEAADRLGALIERGASRSGPLRAFEIEMQRALPR